MAEKTEREGWQWKNILWLVAILAAVGFGWFVLRYGLWWEFIALGGLFVLHCISADLSGIRRSIATLECPICGHEMSTGDTSAKIADAKVRDRSRRKK